MRVFRTALAAALLCAAGAQASPLHYDEAVEGDIEPNGLGTLTDFNLTAGRHTFIGTMRLQTQADGDFLVDLDPFRIVLGAGTQLGQVAVKTVFSNDTGNTAVFETTWTLYNGLFDQYSETCFALHSSENCAASPAGSTLFAGRGFEDQLYNVIPNASAYGVTADQPWGGSFAYELTLDVNAVPEPGSLALALGALPLLALRRRRA